MADASSESEEEYESIEYSSADYISSSISEEDVDFKSHTFKTEQQREERRLLLKRNCMENIRKKRKEYKDFYFGKQTKLLHHQRTHQRTLIFL